MPCPYEEDAMQVVRHDDEIIESDMGEMRGNRFPAAPHNLAIFVQFDSQIQHAAE
jgi:hypothetical protein